MSIGPVVRLRPRTSERHFGDFLVPKCLIALGIELVVLSDVYLFVRLSYISIVLCFVVGLSAQCLPTKSSYSSISVNFPATGTRCLRSAKQFDTVDVTWTFNESGSQFSEPFPISKALLRWRWFFRLMAFTSPFVKIRRAGGGGSNDAVSYCYNL